VFSSLEAFFSDVLADPVGEDYIIIVAWAIRAGLGMLPFYITRQTILRLWKGSFSKATKYEKLYLV